MSVDEKKGRALAVNIWRGRLLKGRKPLGAKLQYV